jgi:DNA-binding XRE family transcriptional regulator
MQDEILGGTALQVPPPSSYGADELQAWRRYRGLNRAELARKLGYSRSYISLIEKGRLPITDRFRRRLAKRFAPPRPRKPRLCPKCGEPIG